MVDGIEFLVPGDLRNTPQPVESLIVVPLLLAGKDESYRLAVYGKVRADDRRDYTYSNLKVVTGFDNLPKPIANSIQLEFSDKSLTISTETDEKVILKASWHVGGHTGYGLEASAKMENPKVELNYAAIPRETSGTFPAIDLVLQDADGHTLQEAKLAVKVASSQTVTSKVVSVKNQPTDSNESKKTKFSWSELVKTGLGGLMKFFL